MQIRVNFALLVSTGQVYAPNAIDGIPNTPIINGSVTISGVTAVTIADDGLGSIVVSVTDPATDDTSVSFHNLVNGVLSLDIPIQVTDGQTIMIVSGIFLQVGGNGFTPASDTFGATGSTSITLTTVPQ